MRANTGVQDSLLHNPAQSPFAYQAPMTCCNYIQERVIYQPLNFSGLAGTKYNFSLTKQADLLGPVMIYARIAALTQPETPPAGNVNAVRYINNLGIGMLESVRVFYGSNLICNIPPEWMFIRYRKYLNLGAQSAWRVLSRMDQALPERTAFAAAGGEIFVNLCVPWGDDTSQYYSMCGMASELRFEITVKPLRNLLNWDVTDNADPAALLQGGQSTAIFSVFNLHCECVHLTGAERDTVVANVKSTDGLAKLVEDVQAHIRVLIPPTGSSFTYQLKLTNINAPVSTLFWYLEDPLLTAGSPVDNEFGGDFPHHAIPGLGAQYSEWSVTSNGQMVVPVTSSLISRFYNHARWFSSVLAGEYINSHSFSQNPEIPNASYGTVNFGQLDLPQLNITFPSGLNNAYNTVNPSSTAGAYLNVIADTKNFFHEQGGDFTRTFY